MRWNSGLRAAEAEGSDPRLRCSPGGPRHFRTSGIPLLKGRGFATDGQVHSPPVATWTRRRPEVFPGLDPIGQRVHLDLFKEPLEVIGVVGPVKHWGLDPERSTGARLQAVRAERAVARWTGAAGRPRGSASWSAHRDPQRSCSARLRAALRAFDSGQVMNNERAMEEGISRSLASRRFSLVMIRMFALLATALSAVGIYGLASYLAHERTTEMGVRIALGAQRRDILQALLGSVGQVAALGSHWGWLPRSAWRT